MRRRLVALHALMMGGLVAVAACIPGCFPDPPADDGLLDSGIFLSDGSSFEADTDGATSGLSLSTLTVDFGLSECGGLAPKNQTLTLTNTSADAVSYGIQIAGYEFALASATDDSGDDSTSTTGTIAAGQSVDIALSASAVPSFATAGGLTEGALQVVTNAPGQKLFVVDLKETAAGAQLTMIPNMASSVADFGFVNYQGGVAQIGVGFRNNGNEPITIAFDDQPQLPFALQNDDDAGEGFTVAANSTTTLKATYDPTIEEGQSTATLGFHTTGVTCGGGDPPAAIRLQGTPSFSGVNVVPGTLVFDVGGTGFVPCGKVGAAQTVTVANPIGSERTDLAVSSFGITGPFTVSLAGFDPTDAASSVPVPPGDSVSIIVTPQSVLAASTATDGVSGQLMIFLSDEESFTIRLSQSAQGAVLAFSEPVVNFGDTPLDTPAMRAIGIINSGNAAAGITLGVTGSPYFSASPSAQFGVNTPGGSTTLTFLPIAAEPAQATLSLVASGALCAAPPTPITLNGNGVSDAGAADSGFDAGGAITTDSGLP